MASALSFFFFKIYVRVPWNDKQLPTARSRRNGYSAFASENLEFFCQWLSHCHTVLPRSFDARFVLSLWVSVAPWFPHSACSPGREKRGPPPCPPSLSAVLPSKPFPSSWLLIFQETCPGGGGEAEKRRKAGTGVAADLQASLRERCGLGSQGRAGAVGTQALCPPCPQRLAARQPPGLVAKFQSSVHMSLFCSSSSNTALTSVP